MIPLVSCISLMTTQFLFDLNSQIHREDSDPTPFFTVSGQCRRVFRGVGDTKGPKLVSPFLSSLGQENKDSINSELSNLSFTFVEQDSLFTDTSEGKVYGISRVVESFETT